MSLEDCPVYGLRYRTSVRVRVPGQEHNPNKRTRRVLQYQNVHGKWFDVPTVDEKDTGA